MREGTWSQEGLGNGVCPGFPTLICIPGPSSKLVFSHLTSLLLLLLWEGLSRETWHWWISAGDESNLQTTLFIIIIEGMETFPDYSDRVEKYCLLLQFSSSPSPKYVIFIVLFGTSPFLLIIIQDGGSWWLRTRTL